MVRFQIAIDCPIRFRTGFRVALTFALTGITRRSGTTTTGVTWLRVAWQRIARYRVTIAAWIVRIRLTSDWLSLSELVDSLSELSD